MTDEVASKFYSTDAPEDMSATYLTKRKVIGYIYLCHCIFSTKIMLVLIKCLKFMVKGLVEQFNNTNLKFFFEFTYDFMLPHDWTMELKNSNEFNLTA